MKEYLSHILDEFENSDVKPLAGFYGKVANAYMKWGCVRHAFDTLDLIKRKNLHWNYGICGAVFGTWLGEHVQELPPQFIPLLARLNKMSKESARKLDPDDENSFKEFVKFARSKIH